MSNRTDNAIYEDMTCSECGETHQWPYCEEHKGNCFTCQFWLDRVAEDRRKPKGSAIVDGIAYHVGNENEQGGFRGFAGSKFEIEFDDDRKVKTTNLWCQGKIPARFRDRLPNNAKFIH